MAPRSLNEPVACMFSCLTKTLAPVRSDRRGRRQKGRAQDVAGDRLGGAAHVIDADRVTRAHRASNAAAVSRSATRGAK